MQVLRQQGIRNADYKVIDTSRGMYMIYLRRYMMTWTKKIGNSSAEDRGWPGDADLELGFSEIRDDRNGWVDWWWDTEVRRARVLDAGDVRLTLDSDAA